MFQCVNVGQAATMVSGACSIGGVFILHKVFFVCFCFSLDFLIRMKVKLLWHLLILSNKFFVEL